MKKTPLNKEKQSESTAGSSESPAGSGNLRVFFYTRGLEFFQGFSQVKPYNHKELRIWKFLMEGGFYEAQIMYMNGFSCGLMSIYYPVLCLIRFLYFFHKYLNKALWVFLDGMGTKNSPQFSHLQISNVVSKLFRLRRVSKKSTKCAAVPVQHAVCFVAKKGVGYLEDHPS